MIQGSVPNHIIEDSSTKDSQANSIQDRSSIKQLLIILIPAIILIGLVFYLYLRFIKIDPARRLKNPARVEEAQDLIEEELGLQYNNWPLALEQENYHLFCIASQDMYHHEPFIELPDGSVVTHSIPCQYFDAEGNEQIVFIPVVRFKLEENENLVQYLGYTPVVNHPDYNYEKSWERYSVGVFKDTGPMKRLDNHGYVGAGQIMLITFGLLKERPMMRFANEAEQLLYSQQDLTNFAQTGDSDLLYNKMLFPQGAPFNNRFSELQKTKD